MNHTEHGDSTAMNTVILRTVVGSGVHGIAIEGTDDHDEMAVYIERPENVMGAATSAEHYIWRTQPEGQRSGPGDTDLVAYSLRKYARLAIKGNPTVVVPLWAPAESVLDVTPAGERLRATREAFLSAHAVRRFLGYMAAQHERMMGGGKRNRVPNRPELIEAYGWDVKYGSHALRLAMQGYEIASTGRLTLPLPGAQRNTVLEVKRGLHPRDTVSAWVTEIAADTQALLDTGRTAVPPEPDVAAINTLLIDLHRESWGWS